MAETHPQQYHLSASAIQSFKACPTRFRLGYREGVRLLEDTDAQRVGTNWHALHEVYQSSYQRNVLSNDTEPCDEDAHTHAHAAALDAAIEHLNAQYETVPSWKTEEEWEIERQILITSFVGYLWYWEDDMPEPVAQEVPFDLPLHEPLTGMPVPTERVIRRGKIDEIVRWQGCLGNLERKSTSRGIGPDSDYWERSRKDTQVSMYALAFADMREHGLAEYGIEVQPGERVGNTIYDVWHKPTIKPKKLSQKDTATLIETGEYCGQPFEVEEVADQVQGVLVYTVNGQRVEADLGKSGKPAIQETPGMFAARLLADIQERPEFYFARREIVRTDAELARFRGELFNIYQAMKAYSENGCWFENESQCRATFSCAYIPICYGPGADAVCDGETTPPGFTRIFDVTVEGKEIGDAE